MGLEFVCIFGQDAFAALNYRKENGQWQPNDESPYSFIINGIEIKTPHEKLAANDILQLAINSGAIAGKPDDYVLESHDPPRQFKADDVVDLAEYKEFITERSGPTPVAEPFS